MPFPDEALAVDVELKLGGVWTSITDRVKTKSPITITRGRSAEGDEAEPTRCSLTIRNTDGWASPRNPLSPWYGLIGRNTPIRVTVEGGSRFVGEVPEWPVTWDPAGNVEVQIEAAGIMRRLGQGAAPLRSAMTRALLGETSLGIDIFAWWPLEDAPGSRQAAPGIPGQPPLFAVDEVTFTGEPSGGIGGGVTFDANGRLLGRVLGCPPEWAVAVWFDLPADMDASSVSPVVQWTCPGSFALRYWSMFIGSGAAGFPFLEVANANGVVTTAMQVDVDLRGRGPMMAMAEVFMSAGDAIITLYADNGAGGEGFQDTVAATPSAPIVEIGTNADINTEGIQFAGTISHLMVVEDIIGPLVLTEYPAAKGYVGERAADRIARLCDEEGVPVTITGEAADSEPMGAQHPDTLLNLLAECAAADGGTLGEQRDEVGLAYRTRAADYNTTPALSLDYHDQVAHPLHPTDDDRHLRNDYTVERRGGSLARAVLETGPLSVLAPPDGVGIYDESVTLNLAADTQLADQAGWRLHLGTVDEARWPLVKIKLHKHPDLIASATAVDLRSVIEITGLPPWLPPDDVRLIVDGYTEVIEPLRWTLEWNTVPQSPYRVGVLDDAVLGRLDTDGAELAAPAGDDDTSLSVATPSGPLWTTDDAEFPFDVEMGGEVITVTDITGATSPQTFTVTRGVNGVTKSHPAGTAVQLAQPMILSF